MSSQPERQLPRCALCSMCCPLGAEIDELGHVNSTFPVDLGVEQGSCVLGLTAARLLRAGNRIYNADCDGHRMGVEEAVGEVAGRLSVFQDAQVAFVLDVNRPLEGIAAAAALRSRALPASSLALFVPPEDEPFVRAGLGQCPPVDSLAECNMVVSIGDPFSSHPVVSRPIRDVQLRGRGRSFVSVDTALGRTARSADECILIDPFKLAGFLCAAAIECGSEDVREALGGASAEEVCGKLGLDAEGVRALAAGLKGADRAAIVISCARGRYANAGAVVRAAAQLASAADARLFALPVSPNTAAAGALTQRFDMVGLAGLLDRVENGELRALVVVGVDFANVLPAALWKELADKLDLLVWAGSLASEFGNQAQVVLPLALPWEESGHIVAPGGGPVACERWAEAPGGVLTAVELMKMLGEKLGAIPIEPEEPGELASAPVAGPLREEVNEAVFEVPELADGEAILIGAPEPYGYTGGISVSGGSWQRRMGALERATVSRCLAAEIALQEGECVTVGNGAEATLPCTLQDVGEAKVVALPSHRPDVRELLEWKVKAGRVEISPSVVRVSKLQ